MVRSRSSPGRATTARRCSSTISAPANRERRNAGRPGRRRRPTRRSPSIARPFFYRHALELAPAAAASGVERGTRHALANAGRPAEAADAYLRRRGRRRATQSSRAPTARRRAVSHRRAHRLRSRPDRTSCSAVLGVRCAAQSRASRRRLLWQRARLRWRGLGFELRRADDIDRGRCFASTRAGRSRRDWGWSTCSTVGFHRASSLHGARRRRTVPGRSRVAIEWLRESRIRAVARSADALQQSNALAKGGRPQAVAWWSWRTGWQRRRSGNGSRRCRSPRGR